GGALPRCCGERPAPEGSGTGRLPPRGPGPASPGRPWAAVSDPDPDPAEGGTSAGPAAGRGAGPAGDPSGAGGPGGRRGRRLLLPSPAGAGRPAVPRRLLAGSAVPSRVGNAAAASSRPFPAAPFAERVSAGAPAAGPGADGAGVRLRPPAGRASSRRGAAGGGRRPGASGRAPRPVVHRAASGRPLGRPPAGDAAGDAGPPAPAREAEPGLPGPCAGQGSAPVFTRVARAGQGAGVPSWWIRSAGRSRRRATFSLR